MDFTIITQGQRIRDIRKKLGLKQDDLSGDTITRNLISMIETDKASLTPKAAEIIHKNLKRFIDERNIDINIDDIFITEEDQARRIYEEFLKHIEDVGVEAESLLNDMISITNKYELNYMKVYIYGNLGREFRLEKDMNTASKYLSMANEFAKMSDVDGAYFGKIKLELSHCYNRLKRYEEGIRDSNNIASQIDTKYIVTIIHNKILMLKGTKRYEEALKEIEELSTYYSEEISSLGLNINLAILKGNCYRAQGYLNKAVRIYKETLKNIKDSEECLKNKFLVLSNIMEVSTILEDDYDQYLNELVDEIDKNKIKFEENYFASEIYKWIANSYEGKKEKNTIQFAYEYILKSLQLAKRDKNKDIIDDDLNKLIDYISHVEDCTIENVQEHILSLLQGKMIKPDSKVILKLINFHMVNNNHEEAKDIVDFCKSRVS